MKQAPKRKTPDAISKKRQRLYQEVAELKEKEASHRAGYVLTIGRPAALLEWQQSLSFLEAEIDSRHRALRDLREKGRKPWVDKSWYKK